MFYHISTTFYIIIVQNLCKLRHKILVVFSHFLRYVVAKSYNCLHKQSIPVTFFMSPRAEIMVTLRTFSPLSSLFRRVFRPFSGLTFKKIYVKFSLSAVTKTCVTGKIPREASVWCKDAVPLPVTIPLPSRVCGNATPGAPVKASMSDGYAVTRVEPWNTFVSHP